VFVQEKMNNVHSLPLLILACNLAKFTGCSEPVPQMHLLQRLLMDRRVRAVLMAGAILAVAAGVTAWQMGLDLNDLKAWWAQLNDYLVKNPWALFLAIVVLPGFPVPLSALLFTAGVVWRQQPVMACLLCLLGITLNLTWTYWLAAGPGRKIVEKILVATSVKIPELPKGDHLKLILILKLTPGIPHFFQNYLLGFLRVPFMLYLPVSVVCNGVIGTGVVLSGVGLADGRLLPALTGISLIAVGVVLTQFLRGWLARRKQAMG
jgi:uncharacterized membrane protein YdjX (TVP38/TMEM64 family)